MERIHHIHRVPKHDDDLRRRRELGDLLGRGPRVQVPGAGLTHALTGDGVPEQPEIVALAQALMEMTSDHAEVHRLLMLRHEELRVLSEVRVERCRPAARCADDEEVRSGHAPFCPRVATRQSSCASSTREPCASYRIGTQSGRPAGHNVGTCAPAQRRTGGIPRRRRHTAFRRRRPPPFRLVPLVDRPDSTPLLASSLLSRHPSSSVAPN